MADKTVSSATKADFSAHPGLRAMLSEMGRQCSDALLSLDSVQPIAQRVAGEIRARKNVVLYGMGGSHHVNCIVEPLYREAGFACRSVIASDALLGGLMDRDSVSIFTSQSGESGEIVELLKADFDRGYTVAITLDPNSSLAHLSSDVLAGHGGPEQAFAATRSIVLTIAMHAAILEALGVDQAQLREVLRTDNPSGLGDAAEMLGGVHALVFAGRHLMSGVAASAALSMMELSRVPSIGFETGQFKHGPLEMIGPHIGVVLLRGTTSDGIPHLAGVCQEAGSPTVVLDATGGHCYATSHLRVGQLSGLAAAMQMLLTLQHLNIEVAMTRVSREVGTPVRTSKITK